MNFTDRVQTVLLMARDEAIQLRHGYVGTEHQLLGLVREGEGVAAAVLMHFSIGSEEVRERVERMVQRGTSTKIIGELPYTSTAKRVLELAMAEARELKHVYVGTEHLLLGMLRGEQGTASEVLRELGMSLESTRAETVRLLGGQPPVNRMSHPRPRSAQAKSGSGGIGELIRQLLSPLERPSGPAPAAPPSYAFTLDDASPLSIYEQLVAQVQESVATGELQPGDRLPPVRGAADALDIAPGTVARAYRALEGERVVTTEGARGTFIAQPQEKTPADRARPDTLEGLLRPVAVAAYHLGATAGELRNALEAAMKDIFDASPEPDQRA